MCGRCVLAESHGLSLNKSLSVLCSLQLYTLLAICGQVEAKSRIELLVPADADPEKLTSLLAGFNISDTSCYDPNEQAKVMNVIQVCGERDFNKYIRRLYRSGIIVPGTRAGASAARMRLPSIEMSELTGADVLSDSSLDASTAAPVDRTMFSAR